MSCSEASEQGRNILPDDKKSEETKHELRRLRHSEILFKQGSFGSTFYIIKSGLIELQFDGRTRKLLRKGDFFGEIGPLSRLPRTATAKALAPSELLEFNSEQLQEILLEDSELASKVFSKLHGRLFQHSMKKQTALLQTNEAQYEDFLKSFELRTFPAESILCKEGDFNRDLYFIRRGQVAILKAGKLCATLGPGDFLGEVAALYGVPRTATLKTLETCELLECSGQSVTSLLEKFQSFRDHLMDLALKRMRK